MVYSSYLTKYIKNLILTNNNDERLVRQFVVDEECEYNDELNTHIDSSDDHAINCMDGLYHRYPSKVLIFPTQKCLGCCRFCFRKNIRTEEHLPDDAFDEICKHISNNPSITEVIFSGGDPFAIGEGKLICMVNRIKEIKHVDIIRIHTRALTFEPKLITQSFVDAIKVGKPIFMVFHVNSHLEITDEATEKLSLLAENGILCFSQTALLRGVNDNHDDLSLLFKTLIQNRVKPYYLFHPDRVMGTGHFYISLEKGKELYRNLFNRISGLAMPIYLFNVPGGHGHCLVDLDSMQREGNEYKIQTWDKKEIVYNDVIV